MVGRKTTLIMITTDLNLKCLTIAKVSFVMMGHPEIVIVVHAKIIMIGPIKSYYNALHFIALH